MKKVLAIFFATGILLSSCTKTNIDKAAGPEAANDLGSRGNEPAKQGVITASEWNDLSNWSFWTDLMTKKDFSSQPSHWQFYNTNRISFILLDPNNGPIANVIIQLKKEGLTVFTARTDNRGVAELWPNLAENQAIDLSQYSIDVNNGDTVIKSVKSFDQGVNQLFAKISPQSANEINVAFVVDATGSMGDEIKYLKTEMGDVLNRVRSENPNSNVRTSSVFYRDTDDEYETRVSEFSDNTQATIDFLNKQEAGGGGDYPEAVHTALDKAVSHLAWNESAKTKIVFLMLDAPAHYKTDVIRSLQNSAFAASAKGIKIIPILASGGDKDAEFLMRFMAITTNGTYVFITDDSGKGNKHMEATVGSIHIEFLNNLMARLINKYAE